MEEAGFTYIVIIVDDIVMDHLMNLKLYFYRIKTRQSQYVSNV
jgi:hypothetical protein